mmetsp:Transcript_32124/g.78816  ORF Transcript_32124/g.78816 Transcript_32124/m.78816 type:complete len:329 (+) Transcript_32124:825-1811(+)
MCGCIDAKDKRHACDVSVQIFRTAEDIYNGNVCITLKGQHVPPGTATQHAPLDQLRPDATNARPMVRDIARGGTGASDLSKQRALLSSDSAVLSTRYDPKKESLESKAKYVRRKENGLVGGEMSGCDDWRQTNLLITTRLIQTTTGMVVLSPRWALLLLRDHGGELLGTDAKKDTTVHCKSSFSSIRCPTPKGFVGVVVWVAEGEDGGTLKTAFDAVATNVPCNHPDCKHKVVSKWQRLGVRWVYMQDVSCFPDFGRNTDFRPWMVHDKHIPTLYAVIASLFACSLLDGWHAHKAVSDQVTKVIGISKEAAHELDWAVRLYRRSLSLE